MSVSKLVVCIAAVAAAIGPAQPARADRAALPAMPVEVLLDLSDVVVKGKVVELIPLPFSEEVPVRTDLVVIRVDSVLKGPAGLKQVRVLRNWDRASRGWRTNAEFGADAEGLRLLKDDAKPDHCRIDRTDRLRPAAESDEIAKILKARSELGGRPVGGLAARAEVVPRDGVYVVRFSLKNVSDKPVVIEACVGRHPNYIGAEWSGPGGRAAGEALYDPAAAPAPARDDPRKDLVTLKPGQAHFVEAGYPYMGVRLAKPAPGEYKVRVRYAVDALWSRGHAGAWTGLVESNEVVFTVR